MYVWPARFDEHRDGGLTLELLQGINIINVGKTWEKLVFAGALVPVLASRARR